MWIVDTVYLAFIIIIMSILLNIFYFVLFSLSLAIA